MKKAMENVSKPEHLYMCHPESCDDQLPLSCHPELVSRSNSHSRTAFTLAEVLITLAIIGVVAAMAIPSVISNAQQQEFKTGLRKAVSVLNSAITMNIALEGETPYDNHDLFRYLQRHMSVMKSTTRVPFLYVMAGAYSHTATFYGNRFAGNAGNVAFYTTDGMRYEFYVPRDSASADDYCEMLNLHESNELAHYCTSTMNGEINKTFKCGSYGLTNNPNNTTATPCVIAVDVNGDRKPFPANAQSERAEDNKLVVPFPNSKKVSDVFTVMITEDRAVPYGVVAQKAMYQAQK